VLPFSADNQTTAWNEGARWVMHATKSRLAQVKFVGGTVFQVATTEVSTAGYGGEDWKVQLWKRWAVMLLVFTMLNGNVARMNASSLPPASEIYPTIYVF